MIGIIKKMIGIIDINVGNIQSVVNALNYLKIKNTRICEFKDFNKCSKIILPGVGSFKYFMEILKNKKLDKIILEEILIKKKPFLGICLGMQLLYTYSMEHGGSEGMNIIKGNVVKIPTLKNIQIPNIGWREIDIKKNNLLFRDITEKPIFYFVHSYYCNGDNKKIVSGSLLYGNRFDVSIEYENVFGTQFHPEKSQKIGLNVLENFNKI